MFKTSVFNGLTTDFPLAGLKPHILNLQIMGFNCLRYCRRSGITNTLILTKPNQLNSLVDKKLSLTAGTNFRANSTVFRRLIGEPVKYFPRDHLPQLLR